MSTVKRTYIELKTPLPGPIARELWARKEANVPRGPFTTSPTFVAKAEGALLTDVDGNTLIDFAGAIGSINAGHCPPTVVKALQEQVQNYLHTCFHVMMYEPYVKLAEKLNEITPGNHSKKTFFLNSGAEAVENAVKLARKYTGRKGIISFERGYHGRTLMAMSLTSKVRPYKYQFGPFAPETYKMNYPYYYRAPYELSAEQLDEQLLRRFADFFLAEVPADEVAAVIMEPVQGEGGFIIPSRRFVQGVKAICEQHGILFIADEVQTGFGRTGKLFGIEHYEIIPDIMVMSKSIAAGLPISAVTGRAEIMDAANPGEIGGTYGGSPLGCVAALEVIKLMEAEALPDKAQLIGTQLMNRLAQFRQRYREVGDVRGIGAMCALEIVSDKQSKEPDKELTAKIIQACNQRGLVILSAGLYSNVVRILCPLVITEGQLNEGLDVLEGVLTELCTPE
ncbi:4-aminobutyrate--2-oxoglutarate transaminase [Brevibacillus fulvus]|uniref:(S)-3-amino-2-methylpropionate transaminase n=1 Tax=Brevibacillus fulvus TaxID=1125967 RepID=A0A938XXT9_9BACL|nr:4-aminobutyrate--2-oxoglutarate transaminase [Brevibacillus fulvus]MBM7588426.1 4-aminobutyrate aminotransferase/(S)-3-amino-2-methylpropionate transaminase [Brevibacillus fulvus]